MLGALISLMVTVLVVLPIKLFLVAPLHVLGFVLSGGGEAFALAMKGFGWGLSLLLLPLRLL